MLKKSSILFLLLPLVSHASEPKIDAVYLAQTHVQAIYFNPEKKGEFRVVNPYLKLVGNRDTLMKVHITAPKIAGENQLPPSMVRAIVFCNDVQRIIDLTHSFTLAGLPESIPVNPANLVHQKDNAFIATIPGECVTARKLNLTLETDVENLVLGDIQVGAPTELHLNVFNIDIFGGNDNTFPAGWQVELKDRLPIAKLNVSETSATFTRIVIPASSSHPAKIMYSDPEDPNLPSTGESWQTELNTSAEWQNALHEAAGEDRSNSMYATHIGFHRVKVRNKGKAPIGTHRARAPGGNIGLMQHELGHAFSLGDWGGYRNCGNTSDGYPRAYRAAIDGISDPNVCGGIHAGPTWGYDQDKDIFVDSRYTSKGIQYFKREPMRGGGLAVEDPSVVLRHFSDYSVNRMQKHLEKTIAVWDADRNRYVSWDSSTGTYGTVLYAAKENYTKYPIERNVEVFSLMANIDIRDSNSVNLVYPPIGPYTSGVIRLFDPANASDRIAARDDSFCIPRCDVSLRVHQGSTVKTYMLNVDIDPSLGETEFGTIQAKAVNVLKKDGPIARVELIKTPNASFDGVPAEPEILSYWPEPVKKEALSTKAFNALNHPIGDTLKATDDVLTTYWSTSADQKSGDRYLVEMDHIRHVNSVVLNSSKNPNHFPRVYKVLASIDGSNWTQVKADNGSSEKISIFFDTIAAKFIQIELLESYPAPWSIDELDIFYDLQPEALSTAIIEPTSTMSSKLGITVAASDFDSESAAGDDYNIRNMGSKVGYIKHNSWILFKDYDLSDGANSFTVNGATPSDNNALVSIRLDSPASPPIASIVISNTNGWDNFRSFSSTFAEISGVRDLYLTFEHPTGGEQLFDIRDFVFDRK